MPRKFLIHTNTKPYHIMARTHNREWFDLPPKQSWKVFSSEIARSVHLEGMQVHAFVLMSNHYHLLATFPDEPISVVMQNFQRQTAKRINGIQGTINQVFGGPYKACMIRHDGHYLNALKYVWFNPVRAGICDDPILYPWSTLHRQYGFEPLHFPIHERKDIMPSVSDPKFDEWIQGARVWSKTEAYVETGHVLRRTEFKYPGYVLKRLPELAG